ncbi:MAG: (2Fe-2S)-binding protein [Gemmatimonadaceae bacterium]|jgi:aerobic-type carbon monoxide dehydrogenase small subunit (CoxS/CutS family)
MNADAMGASDAHDETVSLRVNGELQAVAVSPDTPLLYVLRDTMGLTGTKYGCGIAACGACTVHVEGQPVRSCVMPVSTLAGKAITTIEGATGPVTAAVQAAWTALDVAQCGYCQSGQVMAAVALLTTTPSPTDAEIDRAMQGNVCRCGTYPRIRAGIHQAAATLRGGAVPVPPRP